MDKKFLSTFFKGVVSTSFGTVLKVGFHFLSVMMLARFVSKDALGIYFLALVVINFLLMISNLGLDITLVKYITGKERIVQNENFMTSSLVQIISVVIVSIAFLIVGKWILPILDEGLNIYIGLMALIFIVTMVRDWFLRLMQGLQRFKGFAVAEIVSAFSRVILLLVWQDRLTISLMLIIEVVVLIPAIVVQLYVSRDFLRQLSFGIITKEKIRELTRFGFPLYMNNILNFLMNRGGTLLIGGLLTVESVAAYEIALKIPDGFGRLFTSFILVYFPSQSILFSDGDSNEAQKFMNNTLVLLSTLLSLLVLVSFLFRDVIILIFSSEYSEVALTFALLMLGFYQRAISNVLGYSIVSAGKSSAPVITNLVATVVNIVSSLILISEYGYIGAAYSLILMNTTSQIVYLFFLKNLSVKTDLIGYLKPLIYMTVFVLIYMVFINGTNWVFGILIVAVDMVLCWVTIEPVRNFSTSAFEKAVKRFGLSKA